jgi:hypothetical protein
MATSHVAQFRASQSLQEQSARLGLQGYALTTPHDVIVARAQQGAERILQLLKEGKQEQAHALWNTPSWGIEENDEHAM